MKITFAILTVCSTFGMVEPTLRAQQINVPQPAPYTNDAHTLLLEHFDGTTSGSVGGGLAYKNAVFGKGVCLNQNSWVSWNLGTLPEATVEFWGKVEGLYPGWNNAGIGTFIRAGYGNLFAYVPTFMTYIVKTNIASSLVKYTDSTGDGGPFTNATITANTWHHYATTWGSQGFHFYLDGTLVYSSTNTEPQHVDTVWWVTAGPGTQFQPGSLTGVMDELRISDTQRTFASFPRPSLSIGVSKVNVTQYVVVGRTYVVEASLDLKTWTQVKEQFTATTESITEEYDVTGVGRFFRIREIY